MEDKINKEWEKQMTRQDLIKNIMVNFKQYGITEIEIDELINSGLESGLTLDAIYVGIKLSLSRVNNTDDYFSVEDVMAATGATREEVIAMIEKGREELTEAGENPDEYFVECQSNKFMY